MQSISNREFALSEVQTLQLEMKLRRLTGLEQNRIESELEELYKRIDIFALY